jgi:3-deoxy-D-manno-octulosonate 8-phosphate phosphatase (KDO 8-P phosphatase)
VNELDRFAAGGLGVPPEDPVAANPIPHSLARAVRLVILDVDGVLTDAGVYLGETSGGEAIEFKRFDIQDGLGIQLLRESGIEVALISGRVSAATTLRAHELGIEECHQDAGARKLPLARDLLRLHEVDWGEVAMLADDLPDLPVFEKVGLPAAVANAVEEIRERAAWIGRREGGRGAVREFARALLEARNEWTTAVENYCVARGNE